MSQVITNTFENYWQSCLTAEQPVVLDEFILADIPNLDITSPIDPETGLPPESQIVHRQNVDQRGRINNNAVAYTIVMDTTVGDFSFNAMYLRNKQNGVIGMIVYKGRETKLKTDQTTGQTGNSLVKSMLMGYDQAAEATLTHVDAGTWQIDYAARLRGMDEDIRQLQADLYGHHTFVGDGFKVVEKDGAYQVSQGVAIIGGLRVELKAPEVIHPGTKPIGVWVDVHRAGSLLSEHQNHFTIITSVADLTDHVDSNGYQHYVAKLGTVQSGSTIEDGRKHCKDEKSISEYLASLLSNDELLNVNIFEAIRKIYALEGYNLVSGSFESGGILESEKDVLLHRKSGRAYSGRTGYVDAGTNPLTGDFVDRSGVKIFNNVASMSAATWLNNGDLVSVMGYTKEGDGAAHFRTISPSNDGSGLPVGELFANIVRENGEINLEWLGPDVTVQQIRLLLQYGVKFKAKKLTSIHDAFAKWCAKHEFPIAFFGDSTTDGATTTGHTPSVPTVNGVNITESPNAYCNILEGIIKRAIPGYPASHRVVFNAGFDSQSMANGFALNKFDSIFIDDNAPFVKARMIGFSWGVTDVINMGEPSTALFEYSRNLESLILYSIANGRQPFLVSPVPMWITGVNGRNGWQLLALIDEANSNIAKKYNLDVVSLRNAIDVDTNKNGNPLSYFSSDNVHPNDSGHSAIAGGLFYQVCPNVFTKDDIVCAGSPKMLINNYQANIIQKDKFKTKYDFFFSKGDYRFFVYLDEPRIMKADSFCLGSMSVISPMASVVVNNYKDKKVSARNIFSGTLDFYSSSFSGLDDSGEYVAKLPVGLSEISLKVNRDGFGSLFFDCDKYFSVNEFSGSNVEITNFVDELMVFSAGLGIHDSDFRLDIPYLCKGTSSFYLSAVALNILNSAICFHVSSDKSTYNYLKLLSGTMEWWSVVDGVHTKKAEAAKIGEFDTAVMIGKTVRIDIRVASVVTESSSSDTVLVSVNGIKAYELISGSSLSLLNLKQGWGIGLVDLDINGTLKKINKAKVVSNK